MKQPSSLLHLRDSGCITGYRELVTAAATNRAALSTLQVRLRAVQPAPGNPARAAPEWTLAAARPEPLRWRPRLQCLPVAIIGGGVDPGRSAVSRCYEPWRASLLLRCARGAGDRERTARSGLSGPERMAKQSSRPWMRR